VVDGSAPQVPKKAKVATNGSGPDFFEGKAESKQPVVPPEVTGPTVEVEKKLGCPRCYYSPNGCSICRRPGYTPRGPNIRTTGPKSKAKAKAKASAVKKVLKGPGRGKKPGRTSKTSH